jgi:hypothetical protein
LLSEPRKWMMLINEMTIPPWVSTYLILARNSGNVLLG